MLCNFNNYKYYYDIKFNALNSLKNTNIFSVFLLKVLIINDIKMHSILF